MKTLLLIITVLMSSVLYAQQDKQHMVIYYDGDSLFGESLVYETPILKEPYFNFDGDAIDIKAISFLKNNHGYFANLDQTIKTKSPSFAMRIRKGSINLYERIDINVYGKPTLDVPQNKNGKPAKQLASGEHFQFYTMGTGALQKATYTNLRHDLVYSEESMEHLKAYNRYRWLQIGMVAAGVGVITYEIARQEPREMKFTPMMALGTIVAGCSFLVEFPKKDEKWMAVESYK